MIDLRLDGHIARIFFNRPEKLNSLDGQATADLSRAMDEVEASSQVRVLVLTGAGRSFCAGQDLEDPAMSTKDGKTPDIGDIVERRFNPIIMRLQNLNVPSVAAVNGIAAGGGASLALACDLVVAKRSSYFLQAFSKIGLTPDTGSTWFLPHRVGIARAIGLAALAEKLPAAKAAEWGLIWDVFEDEKFEQDLANLVERVAQMPTKAFVRTRQLLHAAKGHTLEQQLSLEAVYIREMGRGADYREGVAAFAEKRMPRFKDK